MRRSRRRRQIHLRHRGRWNRIGIKRGMARMTIEGLHAGLSRHLEYWFGNAPVPSFFSQWLEIAE